MPYAVSETTAVHATASSKRHHPNPPPDIIAEQPEWAWCAAEQPASDSEPRSHETQTELASANRVAFMGQLSASIAEINQPVSAVVMNAEAALRLLQAHPTDAETIRRLLACIVKDGMRTGDIANRTRALIKDASTQGIPGGGGRITHRCRCELNVELCCLGCIYSRPDGLKNALGLLVRSHFWHLFLD